MKTRDKKNGKTARRARIRDKRQRGELETKIRAVIDSMAADWPAYIGKFFKLWENEADFIECYSNELLKLPKQCIYEKTWKEFLAVYSTEMLVIYSRVMDHMDVEEEECFGVICRRLNAAWQQFFAVIETRHPESRNFIEKLSELRRELHEHVVPLFTGEMKSVLTPAWAKAYMSLEGVYPQLAKVLRS